MNILLVGHSGAKPRLVAIARVLRGHWGALVECYFDGDLDQISRKHDLPRADVLVIGLSRESRNEQSPAHEIEADLVRRAKDVQPAMHCCIICDEDGFVSAKYLADLGEHIGLVVAHEPNAACSPAELCPWAKLTFEKDVIAGALTIARDIHGLTKKKTALVD